MRFLNRIVRTDLTEKMECEHRPKEKKVSVAAWGRAFQAEGTASQELSVMCWLVGDTLRRLLTVGR